LGGELPKIVGNSPDKKGSSMLVPEFLFTLNIIIHAMNSGAESSANDPLFPLPPLGGREGMICRDCDLSTGAAGPSYTDFFCSISCREEGSDLPFLQVQRYEDEGRRAKKNVPKIGTRVPILGTNKFGHVKRILYRWLEVSCLYVSLRLCR
jgi:hypothetical protein